MQQPWLFVTLGIGGIAVMIASLFVLAYSNAVANLGGHRVYARMGARSATLAWMAVFAALAESGALANVDKKPPALLMAFVMFVVVGLVLGSSRVGDTFVRGMPLWVIVAAQGFRLPLAVLMYRGAQEGLLPDELTYGGYNFDAVAGMSALIVAFYARKGQVSRRLLFVWNVAASMLLAGFLGLLVASSPLVQAFGDAPHRVSTFITKFPFVWLGSVVITSAVFGHVVMFRSLSASQASSSPLSSEAPSSPQPSSEPPSGARPSALPPSSARPSRPGSSSRSRRGR